MGFWGFGVSVLITNEERQEHIQGCEAQRAEIAGCGLQCLRKALLLQPLRSHHRLSEHLLC